MPRKLSCILVIADDESTNRFHKSILEESRCSHRVQVLQSGKGALYYLSNAGSMGKEGLRFPRPDLILLDIEMPAQDSWDFLEKYKALHEQQKGKVVIAMVNPTPDPAAISKTKNYPMIKEVIHKPLTKKTVESVVRKYF